MKLVEDKETYHIQIDYHIDLDSFKVTKKKQYNLKLRFAVFSFF